MAHEREQKFLMEASGMARWQAGNAALQQWSHLSAISLETKSVHQGSGSKGRAIIKTFIPNEPTGTLAGKTRCAIKMS